MRQVADDVHQLSGFPPDAVNVYLVGDVLIDAGYPSSRRRILRQLAGREVNGHALTHAHPDHFGASHAVCEELGLPLWAPALDAEAVETGNIPRTPSRLSPLVWIASPSPKPHPVARRLGEGDEVAGFRVLSTPGHSPGHVSYWRESDRTLICGDVFFNVLGRTGPPPNPLTYDPEQNRESMRRLAELEPALVLFGHGPPSRDTRRFVEAGRG